MKVQKIHKPVCIQCGTQFFAKRAGAKYCKPACQMANYRASREYRQKMLAAEYEKQQAAEQSQQPQPTPTATEEATQ